jgi:hypothetical protein
MYMLKAHGSTKMPVDHTPVPRRLLASVMIFLCALSHAATVPPTPEHDGAHDFDFLIGDWKVHLRRLPDRLVGSNKWIE